MSDSPYSPCAYSNRSSTPRLYHSHHYEDLTNATEQGAHSALRLFKEPSAVYDTCPNPLVTPPMGNKPTPLRLLISASIPTLSGGHNPFFTTWIPLNALHGSMIRTFHHLEQKTTHLTHCELLTMYYLLDTSNCITAVAGTEGVGWWAQTTRARNYNTLQLPHGNPITTIMSNIQITPYF